jgi:hypothetical protein
MLDLIHQPVTAALAEHQMKLLVDVFFKVFRFRLLDLFQEPTQLPIDPFFRLQKETIKPCKDPDLGHIGEVSGQKFFSAPPTFLDLRLFTVLPFHSIFP